MIGGRRRIGCDNSDICGPWKPYPILKKGVPDPRKHGKNGNYDGKDMYVTYIEVNMKYFENETNKAIFNVLLFPKLCAKITFIWFLVSTNGSTKKRFNHIDT